METHTGIYIILLLLVFWNNYIVEQVSSVFLARAKAHRVKRFHSFGIDRVVLRRGPQKRSTRVRM